MKIFTTLIKYNYYINPLICFLCLYFFQNENINLLKYFVQNDYNKKKCITYNNSEKCISNTNIDFYCKISQYYRESNETNQPK